MGEKKYTEKLLAKGYKRDTFRSEKKLTEAGSHIRSSVSGIILREVCEATTAESTESRSVKFTDEQGR